MSPNRDISVDFFRFVGISCIILAHCGTPWYLFELRNFDVPFMVFISGYCAIKYSSKSKKFRGYVTDRFVRLVIPTWIFLTVYVIARISFGTPLSHEDILNSFLMTGGPIGVWIIRIFFFMSIITPAVIRFTNNKQGVLTLFVLLLINEIIIKWSPSLPSGLMLSIVSILFVYNFAYACALFAGSVWQNFKKKEQLFCISVFLVAFLSHLFYLFAKNGAIILTQAYKNPPALYYLSYALFVSFLLFLLKDLPLVKVVSKNKCITFIGSHTLWIYLWHWAYLAAYDGLFHMQPVWPIKFLFVFGCSVITAFIQVKLVDKLLAQQFPKHKSVINKVFMG